MGTMKQYVALKGIGWINDMNEYWKYYSKLNKPKTVIHILDEYSYVSCLKQKNK